VFIDLVLMKKKILSSPLSPKKELVHLIETE
jgi:hypothetical protein